jgi:hypothetical protein
MTAVLAILGALSIAQWLQVIDVGAGLVELDVALVKKFCATHKCKLPPPAAAAALARRPSGGKVAVRLCFIGAPSAQSATVCIVTE